MTIEQIDDAAGVPRVGLIVPSSNVTMEIEVPAILGRTGFSFHSSRMRMRQVSAEELLAMDAQAERCVQELADAHCDVLAYACLVAVMAQGPGAHRTVEALLRGIVAATGRDVPVISSAGALIDSLLSLGVQKIGVVAPYRPELTQCVVDYIEQEGIHTTSVVSLSVSDNYLVGCIPGQVVLDAVDRLKLGSVDALVLSACVQMPSISLVEQVEQHVGIPVVTAATATVAAILRTLGRSTDPVPGSAGRLTRRAADGHRIFPLSDAH